MISTASPLSRVLEILAATPEPEMVMALSTSSAEQQRLEELTERSHAGRLTDEEKHELDEFLLTEHLVIMAKAKAFRRIKSRA